MIRRVGLAVNPTAGKGRATTAGVALAALLARHGVETVTVSGSGAVDVERRLRTQLALGLDALIVVGGDGMTHLGANVVAGTSVALGIVPAGTGNDIARGLGLRVDDLGAAVTDLVQAIAQARIRRFDAVRCHPAGDTASGGERWFVGVLGAGFDAIVNERANGWAWPRGHLRYDLAILRELPVLRPRQYVLKLDGAEWSTPGLLTAVANCPSYGGGMLVCPHAEPDDGMVDVLVVRPLSRSAFVRLYPKVYRGTHIDDPRVVIRRARQVSVHCDGIVGYADGERLGPLPLTCETVPGALRVLDPSR